MKIKTFLPSMTAVICGLLFSVSAQHAQIELTEAAEPGKKDICGILRVTGKGLPPARSGLNTNQARLFAQRSAIVDSYRNMVKLIQDNNAYLVDGNGLLQFEGFIQGAQVVETRYLRDQSVEVDLVLPVHFLPEVKQVMEQKPLPSQTEGVTVVDVDNKIIEIQQSEWQNLLDETGQVQTSPEKKEE